MKMIFKKFYFIFLFATIFFVNHIALAAYHEANLNGSELGTTTTATLQSSYGNNTDYEFIHDGESGKLKEELKNLESEVNENTFNPGDYLDYTKYNFWILFGGLFLILIILFVTHFKISRMKEIVSYYENKLNSKNNTLEKKDQEILEKDEDIDEEKDDEFIEDSDENEIEDEDVHQIDDEEEDQIIYD